jgi:urea transport system permease protein
MGFGGNNGLTDFKDILAFPVQAPGTRIALYVASGVALALGFLLSLWIRNAPLGRLLVAIRDAESRARFLGHDTLKAKLFVWTLSAMLAGLAGALYVPQVGIINPSEFAPANSIEVAIWVTVGGRGTLLGAPLGALLVNAGKTWFTTSFPDLWLFALGGLFVLVTLVLPHGVVGLLMRLRRPRRPLPEPEPPALEPRHA